MKFLVSPTLQNAASRIAYVNTGDSIFQGRLEAYSCKRASSDKKLSQELDRKYSDQSASLERAQSGQSASLEYSGFTPILASSASGSLPDEFILGESPSMSGAREDVSAGSLGVIPDHSMRKLFIDLLLTLTSMYPDYDFSTVRPEEFVEEAQFDLVVHSINSALAKAMLQDPSLGPALWQAVEEVIQPQDCKIYSYIPDVESSPFCEGNLWSFNYFMFNKTLKRVLFFTCSCARPGAHSDMEESDEDMGYDDIQDDPQMDFSMEDM